MGAKRNLDKVPEDTFPNSKYSGNASNAFWHRVRKVKDDYRRTMIYELACVLQDTEYRVLRALEIAEKRPTNPEQIP
jgi:hypothetical protein